MFPRLLTSDSQAITMGLGRAQDSMVDWGEGVMGRGNLDSKYLSWSLAGCDGWTGFRCLLGGVLGIVLLSAASSIQIDTLKRG